MNRRLAITIGAAVCAGALFASPASASRVPPERGGHQAPFATAQSDAHAFLDSTTVASGVDGSLDPTFGTDGFSTTVPGINGVALGVAPAADGTSYVVAGVDVDGDASARTIVLERLTQAGALDTSFGGDGMVSVDFPDSAGDTSDSAAQVLVQPDGAAVVIGTAGSGEGDTGRVAVARFLPTGAPDTTFGTGGFVETTLPAASRGTWGELQPDGKILVTAVEETDPSISVVLRYLPNGELDTSFGGGDGIAEIDYGVASTPWGLVVQSDGKIAVNGNTAPALGISGISAARLLPDGSLDPSFSDDGMLTLSVGAVSDSIAIAQQADGKLVLVGSASGADTLDLLVLRLTTDGELDPTFDTDGIVTRSFGGLVLGYGVVVERSGRIVAGGSVSDDASGAFLLAGYHPDGSPDTSFGDAGRVITTVTGKTLFSYAMSPQLNGDLLLVGADVEGDGAIELARYLSSGASASGYWLAASDGGVFGYHAPFYGSAGDLPLRAPIVGAAATPDRLGYWLVAADGGVFNYGSAGFFGSAGALTLNKPIVGIAPTPTGLGYWLVASDGGIFGYGDADFFGSAGALSLTKPIVGMAAAPSGLGYWLVASDGGIFSYGDVDFFGSTGGTTLNKPVVGMAATPFGQGYWLAASDGGIFSYGDAEFFGSTGALTLNDPIVGMVANHTGGGYWLAASDGGVFSYGDADFFGSAGSMTLNEPIVAMMTN